MEPVAHINEPELLMNQREAGAIHLRIVALAFAAWIFDFYDLILYSFLLVPIARDLHLTKADSSLALGISFAMTAAGGVIFGFIGDRYGRKPFVVATFICFSIFPLAVTLSWSFAA